MALDRDRAVKLAGELRRLRESAASNLTQSDLAEALSTEGRVASATLSSWESTTSPKTPSAARLSAYARFFCSPRSLEGTPHLIPEDQLTAVEVDRFRELKEHLLDLASPDERKPSRSFQFDAGPVVIICPTMPYPLQGELAKEQNPNFTRLRRYGDLDALFELYGHLRAENSTLDVFHRLDSEVVSDDLSCHVILLGGVGWNRVTRRFQSAVRQVPVTQIEVPELETGEIFTVASPDGNETRFYPEYDDLGYGQEFVADVGFIARLRNPFRINRTLTICNGIHSRGVYGAVRCLTDHWVQADNEKYLADRYPHGEFAVLFRVPVVNNEVASPDLLDPAARLFEWAPSQSASQ